MARAVHPHEARCEACGTLRHREQLIARSAPLQEIPGVSWTSLHCADTPYCRDVISLDDDPKTTPLTLHRARRSRRT